MAGFHAIICVEAEEFPELIIVYQNVFSFLSLDFVVATKSPIGWMPHNTGSHHIEINVYKAPQQMIAIFNSCGRISILPEGPFPIFSLIQPIVKSRLRC